MGGKPTAHFFWRFVFDLGPKSGFSGIGQRQNGTEIQAR
jgi:hypothetical protein